MHWADLVLNALLIATGCAIAYMLLLRRLGKVISGRDLKIADQLAALDQAICALEARLAEHHAASQLIEGTIDSEIEAPEQELIRAESSEEVAPDLQAVIAAAAVAALGRDAHVRSIRSSTSSWSQQGRVLVQGSHNARARR